MLDIIAWFKLLYVDSKALRNVLEYGDLMFSGIMMQKTLSILSFFSGYNLNVLKYINCWWNILIYSHSYIYEINFNVDEIAMFVLSYWKYFNPKLGGMKGLIIKLLIAVLQ